MISYNQSYFGGNGICVADLGTVTLGACEIAYNIPYNNSTTGIAGGGIAVGGTVADGAKVIRVPAGRADIFGVPSYVKGFDKLMVVRPTVFWGSDPLKAFGLSRPGAVVSGVRHPLLCTGEFKDYVKNHLAERCENFISSELVVIDVDGFKAKRLAEKYNAFPADEKKAFADPEWQARDAE